MNGAVVVTVSGGQQPITATCTFPNPSSAETWPGGWYVDEFMGSPLINPFCGIDPTEVISTRSAG
jgi:hypothetical protein